MPAPLSSSVSVDGWKINLPDQNAAIKAIEAAALQASSFCVFTLNLDHLVKLRSSPRFRNAYRKATFVTADGAPVARLCRRQSPNFERTTGADLVVPLAVKCAQARLPIYLFGTSPTVLEIAKTRLLASTGGKVEISGTYAPEENFDPTGPNGDDAISRIQQSGARICFVALGAPKQELLAARAMDRNVKVGFICIGGALDFLANEQVRAPQFFQKYGREWFWRLQSNPRRFFARYAKCAALLARIELVDPLVSLATTRRSTR